MANLPHWKLGGLAWRAKRDAQVPTRACVMCLLRLGIGFKLASKMVPTVNRASAYKLRLRLVEEGRAFNGRVIRNKHCGIGRARGTFGPLSLISDDTVKRAQLLAWRHEASRFQNGDSAFHWHNHPVALSHNRCAHWHRNKHNEQFRRKKYKAIEAYRQRRGLDWVRQKVRAWKKSDRPAARAQRIANSLRARLSIGIRHGKHGSKFIREYCGCSREALIAHIESQFSRGMTWENWGKVWHIDHIIPCRAFELSDDKHAKAASHWSNLRPLKASDNRKKSGRNTHPQMALRFENYQSSHSGLQPAG